MTSILAQCDKIFSKRNFVDDRWQNIFLFYQSILFRFQGNRERFHFNWDSGYQRARIQIIIFYGRGIFYSSTFCHIQQMKCYPLRTEIKEKHSESCLYYEYDIIIPTSHPKDPQYVPLIQIHTYVHTYLHIYFFPLDPTALWRSGSVNRLQISHPIVTIH